MKLTPQQIAQVQDSLQWILPIAPATGERFYELLFARNPEIRSLFQENMQNQARKLMTIIIHVMTHLDQFEVVEGELQALAERHVGYQVEPDHYPLVGEALLDTLSEQLGERWTPALSAAWKAAYGHMAGAMGGLTS